MTGSAPRGYRWTILLCFAAAAFIGILIGLAVVVVVWLLGWL